MFPLIYSFLTKSAFDVCVWLLVSTMSVDPYDCFSNPFMISLTVLPFVSGTKKYVKSQNSSTNTMKGTNVYGLISFCRGETMSIRNKSLFERTLNKCYSFSL